MAFMSHFCAASPHGIASWLITSQSKSYAPPISELQDVMASIKSLLELLTLRSSSYVGPGRLGLNKPLLRTAA